MGIEVVEGREFEWSDDAGQPNAIVLDRWLARRYWPDASPLGRRMVWGEVPGADSVPEESVFTIVGVVETIKQNDLTAPDGVHVGAYYFAHRQNPQSFFGVVARARDGVGAASLAPAARDIANRLDPEVPLFSVQTMDERIDRSLANRRTPMTLLGVFAGVALFLAVVGIYGALSYSVTRRTREMGIRMAMGSAAGDVFRLVLAHGLRVTAFGLVLGVVGSLALAGTLRSFLFGVRPLDPAVMAVVATVLGAAAVVACAVPAWRATRVDPISALTTE
jgi:ABC-type antimicrobial peptide transport system permease subunit